MAIVKKIIKNVFIVLGILIAAMFVCLAIMYFADISMFGLKFKKASGTEFEEKLDAGVSGTYKKIVINSDKLKVYVHADTESNVDYVTLSDDANGLVTKNSGEMAITKTVSDGVYQVNISLPKGIVFWRNSFVDLYLCSETLKNSNFELAINSASSHAEVMIENTDTSYTGLQKLYFNSSKNATLTVSSVVKDVVINSNKGKIDIKTDVNNVDFTSVKSSLYFKKINENLVVNTTNSYICGEQVKGQFTYNGKGGEIEVTTVGTKEYSAKDTNTQINFNANYVYSINSGLFVCTNNCEVKVNNVWGKLNVNSTYGKTEIENLYTQDYYGFNGVNATKGSVTIKNAVVRNLNITTTSGAINVNVGSRYSDATAVNLSSEKGKITANFKAKLDTSVSRQAGYVEPNVTTSEYYWDDSVSVVSQKGKIVLTNIAGAINVKDTKGAVEASFANVNGASVINTQGAITLKVPKAKNCTIKAQSVKKTVEADLGVYGTGINKSHSVVTYNIVDGSETNTITATSAKKAINISYNA